MTSARRQLVSLTAVSVFAGVVIRLQAPPVPPHLGWGIAVLAALCGLGYGLAGFIPVYAGIAASGLTFLVMETVAPSGGEDQRGLFLLYVSVIPALFGVPVIVGALARKARRSDRHARLDGTP